VCKTQSVCHTQQLCVDAGKCRDDGVARMDWPDRTDSHLGSSSHTPRWSHFCTREIPDKNPRRSLIPRRKGQDYRAQGPSLILLPRKTTINPQNNDEQPPLRIVRDAYTLGTKYERVTSGPPDNLECNRLTIVPTLPYFNRRGDAPGMASLPHDTLKSV